MVMIQGGSININSLVQQFKASQMHLLAPLQSRKTTLNSRLTLLGELKGKLDPLHSIADNFSKVGSSSLFTALKGTSSNPDVLTATVSNLDSAGTHQITVDRIAKADTVLSAQFSKEGNEIVSGLPDGGAAGGSQQFNIIIGSVSERITVNYTGLEDNETMLNKIAGLINESPAKVSAKVVSPYPGEVRLVITGDETGSIKAVTLKDQPGHTLLDSIGLTVEILEGRNVAAGSDGGYLVQDVNLLNAKFLLDGINYIRYTNDIDDILDGVTIHLHSASPDPVNLTIGVDTENIKNSIDEFIEAYNDVITFLNKHTKIDKSTLERPLLAGDTAFKSLLLALRTYAIEGVPGSMFLPPISLHEVGIGIAADGTLFMENPAKLDEMLADEDERDRVEHLFNAHLHNLDNGIATLIKNRLDAFVSIDGIVAGSKESTQGRIDTIEGRIERLELRIDQRVARFKDDLVHLQTIIDWGTNQMATIQAINSGFFF